MKILRFNHLVFLCILLSMMILSQGCGRRTETAPDGSTITFNPLSYSQSGISAPTCVTYDVIIRYADGTPFPKAVVTLYGSFAEPRNVADQSPRYQFYSAANCNLPGASGVAVNSGFQGQTDVKGVYTFSALIYDIVTFTTSTGLSVTATNVFSDNIDAYSGTAFGSAKIEVTQ